MDKRNIKTVFALFLYAIAMALVESAVVVYLRELYYPGGFFIQSVADLAVMSPRILNVELWREAATILMLAAVGYLAFNDFRKRVAAFFLAFSIWDLAYYFFLYLFLRWPPSLTTFDVYFLIPWPWIGPAWFPLALFGLLTTGSLWFIIKSKNHES